MKILYCTNTSEIPVSKKKYHLKTLREHSISDAGDYFWSSGSKAIDGKNYVWLSTGKSVSYTNWAKGQPADNSKQCIELSQSRDTGLFWDNLGCEQTRYFICERSDFPSLPPTGPGPAISPTTAPPNSNSRKHKVSSTTSL